MEFFGTNNSGQFNVPFSNSRVRLIRLLKNFQSQQAPYLGEVEMRRF